MSYILVLSDEHLCIGAKINSDWNNTVVCHTFVFALFVKARYYENSEKGENLICSVLDYKALWSYN